MKNIILLSIMFSNYSVLASSKCNLALEMEWSARENANEFYDEVVRLKYILEEKGYLLQSIATEGSVNSLSLDIHESDVRRGYLDASLLTQNEMFTFRERNVGFKKTIQKLLNRLPICISAE